MERWAELEAAAKAAANHSYSPYSHFPVGAAVLTGDGRLFTGTNVENAAFGLSNCAERTAIFSAISAGARQIVAIVTYTPTREPTPPCGACRQVIREFAVAEVRCASICDTDKRLELTLDRLLPYSFSPESL